MNREHRMYFTDKDIGIESNQIESNIIIYFGTLFGTHDCWNSNRTRYFRMPIWIAKGLRIVIGNWCYVNFDDEYYE